MKGPSRTFVVRSAITVSLALGIGFAIAAPASAQSGPCAFIPGRPDKAPVAANSGANTVCAAEYFVHDIADFGGGRRQAPGINISVIQTPDVAAATKMAARPPLPNYRPVSYGNGGWEKLEDPNAPDSAAQVHDLGVLTGEVQLPIYEFYFRCGVYFVMGSADPSKGIAARALVAEMADAMKAASACDAAAPQTQTTAAPPTRPTPPPSTTVPPSVGRRNVFAVGGDCTSSGSGFLCVAAASNPPGGVPLALIKYQWTVDGATQGSQQGTINIPALIRGSHVVTVRAVTPDAIYTDTLTIPIRVP